MSETVHPPAPSVRAIADLALCVRDGRSPVEAARIAGVDPDVAEWLCGHWVFRILMGALSILIGKRRSPSAGPTRRGLGKPAHSQATVKKVERVVSLFSRRYWPAELKAAPEVEAGGEGERQADAGLSDLHDTGDEPVHEANLDMAAPSPLASRAGKKVRVAKSLEPRHPQHDGMPGKVVSSAVSAVTPKHSPDRSSFLWRCRENASPVVSFAPFFLFNAKKTLGRSGRTLPKMYTIEENKRKLSNY
ncbi:MAG: hypothetical protein R3C97_12780 [Geminicoccaceae bacterium]